jgi:hypothetical protein
VNGLSADGVEMGPWLRGAGHGQTEAGVWRDFYRDSQILAGKLPGTLFQRVASRLIALVQNLGSFT